MSGKRELNPFPFCEGTVHVCGVVRVVSRQVISGGRVGSRAFRLSVTIVTRLTTVTSINIHLPASPASHKTLTKFTNVIKTAKLTTEDQ